MNTNVPKSFVARKGIVRLYVETDRMRAISSREPQARSTIPLRREQPDEMHPECGLRSVAGRVLRREYAIDFENGVAEERHLCSPALRLQLLHCRDQLELGRRRIVLNNSTDARLQAAMLIGVLGVHV